MEHLYTFHPALVLRTPARPLAGAPTTAADWLADAAFREALYLASPPLLAEAERWQRGELRDAKKEARLLAALGRYQGRMRSRCTPFGLFAGCSVVGWGPESRLCLDPAATTRHTRLDMHYLCALAARLAAQEPLRSRLRYRPNSSLYDLGHELRYVEYSYGEGRPPEGEHQLSAVEATEPLRRALAASAGGQQRRGLALALLGLEEDAASPVADADLAEALEFVDALIEAQLLVSELEPTVTGAEFLPHLRQVLARLDDPAAPHAGLAAVRSVVADVSARLAALDAHPAGPNPTAAYTAIEAALAPLAVPLEAGKLFQADLLPGVLAGSTLATSQQAALLAALRVLGHLTPATTQARLAEFKQQFAARYEARAVPLLEALDSESGISYSDYGRHAYAPLVEDLMLPGAASPAPAPLLTAAQQLLAGRLRAAEQAGDYAIDLTLAEVQHLPSVADALPPSFSVLFRALAGGQLLLESAGGASAANLLGRFAHASPAIAGVVHSLAAAEQAHNPGVVLAEICHLPASRLGNILLRPCFRDFELPYLAHAACPPAGRLALQDLTLRLHRGQLELWCRRTGHRVVPRLSAAHNYTQQALPVYQLLCDLQTQGLQASLGVSWEALAPEARFRPRLTHQGVVLLAASWQLAAADLAPLLAAGPGGAAEAWATFRRRWQLPRYFTLAEADHELLIDAEDPAGVRDWLALVRARPGVLLKEFLFDPATCLVRDPAGRPYTNQLVASLLRTAPCYPAAGGAAPRPGAPPAAVPRSFEPGSEWLYYKLYCGPKVADRLLAEALAPLTEELLARGWVDKWFFIRYTDPDHHLRLRLHLPAPAAALGPVMQAVRAALAPYTASGSLWKTQTDTYQRELERYGSHTIELAESLFYYDSRRLLARLAAPPPGPGPTGWLGAARGIDELLAAFGCDLPRRLALLTQWRAAFAHEFAVDKPLRLQLDARYRQHRAALHAALAPPPPARPEALPLAGLLAEVAGQVLARHARGQLEVAPDALLGHYAHMLVNRAVSVRPRLHELLVYDFLARYYQSAARR
ncbi:lantibiotic dehydratase [Hymenobacter cheonanensis]|uniref:lantibiotic dehydratase n=1 Tax=Hymenobacter sp. CA2-7 TaxID=3063993 RepID=UPI0027136699|nr:lantibiotic dehydratase [Hymenobacter sp. CA2-7]MDO7888066.1 lantibiotic dehydratase [Hymenobacter sp. CA2-7]